MTHALDAVGTVAVVDLEAACELYGRDTLPYPLGRSRPVGSVWLLTRDVGPIEDRLNGGDLARVRAWVEAFVRADVCVGCRVSLSGRDTPDLRLNGLLAGDLGFVAVQHSDPDGVDAVDVYAVSPGAVGAVIADSVGLAGAGSHLRIAVAGLDDRLPAPPPGAVDEYDDLGFLIPHAESDGPPVHVVDGRDVAAIGTVQSLSGSTRYWVTVDDDGDYLYAPGGAGYAEPLDAETLRACLDGTVSDAIVDVGGEMSGQWDDSVGWDE
ncbi:hypothetical protein B7435_09805 [Mycolicibacterium peregrinum]|uniref:hypothetical protein n=1 Tax=Mycolicibacterium peregrinum TaxID=43304 RepID=UPI0006D7E8BC|nr:hypothetical protein [Mycolicibacterium peregrinum]MCV7204727.1 hypothetical protein [Mycolicibacterium peregrinum]ORW50231.1 hypothetical protein AWC21_33400 [Mycolicibacterium peregrinum]OWM05213.1 hypothetical protein B7435_09805 [Mycolicibacterium peregrinum]